mmetsp:Transcript_38841/g.99306  ORF Transcript_38841/g.99306 Transcript_38841/m.99306 type:complete len:207 (+) Transcript_38841:202-822(+)
MPTKGLLCTSRPHDSLRPHDGHHGCPTSSRMLIPPLAFTKSTSCSLRHRNVPAKPSAFTASRSAFSLDRGKMAMKSSHPSQLYDKGSSAEALVEAASSRLANALASWSALAPLASLQQNPRKGSDLVSATSKARFVATLLRMAAAVVGAAGWPCTKGSGTIWTCLCGWLLPECSPQLKKPSPPCGMLRSTLKVASRSHAFKGSVCG